MEATEIQSLVEDKVKSAIQSNNAELLQSIGGMIAKISSPPSSSSLASLEVPTFKRKSNEEQFKQNAKVFTKLEEAETHLTSQNIAEAKQSIIEAKDLIKRRQKLVQLADTSELGWRVVAEYEANPIASDSDDERRIYKAEARATRKAKSDKSKKRQFRPTPYSRPRPRGPEVPATTTFSQAALGQQQRPGVCFLCGKPGHWKNECLQRDRNTNNKISSTIVSLVQSEVSGADQGGKTEGTHGQADKVDVIQIEGEIVTTNVESKVVSPVGRLRKAADKWKDVTDSVFILDVVENGYRLPFKKIPDEVHLKNNKSARENPEFVQKEIQSFYRKSCPLQVVVCCL